MARDASSWPDTLAPLCLTRVAVRLLSASEVSQPPYNKNSTVQIIVLAANGRGPQLVQMPSGTAYLRSGGAESAGNRTIQLLVAVSHFLVFRSTVSSGLPSTLVLPRCPDSVLCVGGTSRWVRYISL